MAGLLDAFGDDNTRFSLGLLAAAGPRFDGANDGQRIQEALMGMDAYKKQQAQSKMQQMQMEAYQRKVDEEQAQRDWRTGLPAVMEQKVYGAGDEGPTMAPDSNALKSYLMQPNSPFAEDLLKNQLFPKAADYKEVGGTLVRIGSDGVTPVYTAPPKPEGDPTKVQEYKYAKAGGYKGTFEQFIAIAPTIMAAAAAPLRAAQADSIIEKNAYELPPPPPRRPAKPAASAPMRGQIVDGYRFKGGNPADQNNWEKQ